jgi:Flp pilus assembly protein protease CpaA
MVMAYCVMAMPMIAALAFWTPGNFGFAVVRDLFANTIPNATVLVHKSMFSIIALVQSGRECLHTSRPVERSVWRSLDIGMFLCRCL